MQSNDEAVELIREIRDMQKERLRLIRRSMKMQYFTFALVLVLILYTLFLYT